MLHLELPSHLRNDRWWQPYNLYHFINRVPKGMSLHQQGTQSIQWHARGSTKGSALP